MARFVDFPSFSVTTWDFGSTRARFYLAALHYSIQNSVGARSTRRDQILSDSDSRVARLRSNPPGEGPTMLCLAIGPRRRLSGSREQCTLGSATRDAPRISGCRMHGERRRGYARAVRMLCCSRARYRCIVLCVGRPPMSRSTTGSAEPV